jgi:hypothetical protein
LYLVALVILLRLVFLEPLLRHLDHAVQKVVSALVVLMVPVATSATSTFFALVILLRLVFLEPLLLHLDHAVQKVVSVHVAEVRPQSFNEHMGCVVTYFSVVVAVCNVGASRHLLPVLVMHVHSSSMRSLMTLRWEIMNSARILRSWLLLMTVFLSLSRSGSLLTIRWTAYESGSITVSRSASIVFDSLGFSLYL